MLSPNTILQNRYRVIRELGHGGMGTVYEALDQRVNCIVAIKETISGNNDEARRAFEREASLLGNLRHSALPKVMDYFSEEDSDFLVMEFIPGYDLAELLELRGSPFPQAQVMRWADELLKVLEYLHRQQPPILHRDIKPSNLKLTKQGEIFLLDFGLAKGAAGQMPTLITSRSVRGYTPVYASLEQIHGHGTDPRSDLYSLGATLYHLLTGTPPIYAPGRFDLIEDESPDPLPPIEKLNPQVSGTVATVVHRAMSINRRQRPTSAGEMRKALRNAIEEDEHHAAEEEFRRADATRQQREAERRKTEQEAAHKFEEERRLQEAETRKQEEARRQAEELRQREAEQAARRAEAQRERQQEVERQRQEEAERQRREAEEKEARRLAEEARRIRAEEQAACAAEEERKRQEAGARQREEERRRAENLRRREAEEAARRAEAERKRQQEAERQRQEEAELRRREAEENEARRLAEKAARIRSEENAKRQRPSIPATISAPTTSTVRSKESPSTPGVASQPAIETLKTPPPERFAGNSQTQPPVAEASAAGLVKQAHSARGKRKTMMAVGTGAFMVVGALIIWSMRGTSTRNSSSSKVDQSSTGKGEDQSGQQSQAGQQLNPIDDKLVPPAGMVDVPGGTFKMGRDGKDADEYERPAHMVTLSSFFIDKYEVTNDEYLKFVQATGHQAPRTWIPNFIDWVKAGKPKVTYPVGAARKPVTGVSWYDAKAYAEWTRKRLPTEEEWEFAARGTDNRLYPWGDTWMPGAANAGKPEAGPENGASGMVEVGVYKGTSPYGVCDMIGNAWEWTASSLKAYPGGSLPQGLDFSRDLKVLRGGSWASQTDKATTTFRRGYEARGEKRGYSYTGFRLVRDIGKTSSNR